MRDPRTLSKCAQTAQKTLIYAFVRVKQFVRCLEILLTYLRTFFWKKHEKSIFFEKISALRDPRELFNWLKTSSLLVLHKKQWEKRFATCI